MIELVSGSGENWMAWQQIAHDRSAPFSLFARQLHPSTGWQPSC
ncbi:hypothetical protein Syncc8109_0929 [Synechococcus sp. WH 8109]|nr:hypothetical protein Syncc8109_0929 [Synechococcus sp. WH 8109]